MIVGIELRQGVGRPHDTHFITCATCITYQVLFRTSSHKLQVERGRYVGTPREQRICKKCPSLEVEDEYHLLLRCSVYNSLRENLFNLVLQHCGVFTNLSDEYKLIWLLNNENTAILNAICELVQDSV